MNVLKQFSSEEDTSEIQVLNFSVASCLVIFELKTEVK